MDAKFDTFLPAIFARDNWLTARVTHLRTV